MDGTAAVRSKKHTCICVLSSLPQLYLYHNLQATQALLQKGPAGNGRLFWIVSSTSIAADLPPLQKHGPTTALPPGVVGWKGTTESALGPLDRVITTDVPEEIEPFPDKSKWCFNN